MLYWLAAFIILMIIEILTMGLTTIWFAFGCIGAIIAEMAGGNIYVQFSAFAVVSVIFLIFTRPVMKKMLSFTTKDSNIDSIIGRTAVITKGVNEVDEWGETVVDNERWKIVVKDENELPLREGDRVIIKGVDGVKLIVGKENK